MRKAASPLRIPLRNSPKKIFPECNNNNADANQEFSAKDHSLSTLRPPLCPIPEANHNYPASTNAEQDPCTPKTSSRAKLFASGQGQGSNQFSENTCKGSNFGTFENDLHNSSIGFSNTKNRFGWHESRTQFSSATEVDFAQFSSTGLVKHPSQGNIQELSLLSDPPVSIAGNPESVPGWTPNGVTRSLKTNQCVNASTGNLPMVPFTETQNVAHVKGLQSDSKNNFVQHHFELHEDPSFWDDHNVQVVIRIRPLSSIEVASQGHSRCVRQDSGHTITWLGHPESRFTFDLVAGEKISQEKLFKVAGLPMVENCMGGYNSCMFAYGQTGSGKTHTMLGDIEGAEQKLSSNRGMTPRVFEHLFARIRKEEDARKEEKLKFICKCSFLEIYNEQVADLLEPSSTNLQMREDAKKGVYVENLSEVEVKGVNDVIRLLLQGAANRKVAATNMNRASSRSHSVFTCIIESKWESQSVTHHRFGRLNLVDLAGSERQKSSGAEGERLKEASNINKSLSTLGLVIMNLVNIANGKAQHVPYRDSKLTFLLQDSLGGNSKTTIIANVSPSNCCTMETLSTLKFAQRAKFIRNNASVNEDATGDVITLKMQIQQLKEEVSHLRGQLKGVSSSQEDDYGSMALLSSLGPYAWDMKALASPLPGHKKALRKRDLESALAGALKREESLETAMKAMAAENEQLKLLVKQREEDAQCGKMMLRFREDKIKRLEAVASDKMSAEAHLLEEKNVLMEELQILRNRLDRNPEVTRFAMENIRLMEQLRRYQESYEGGELEQMSEQIAVLRDQLLEALDWKLMHEQDPNLVNQKESSEAELSAISEENESLRRQVDLYRREAEALRNNLCFCLEAKEKLERRVDDLMIHFDKMKVSDADGAVQLNSAMHAPELKEETSFRDGLSAERELKDLVEAISAASQREAEAQGTAIFLAREVDDLRKNIKESVEDNERLIIMYEKAMQELDEIRKAEEDAREMNEKSQELVHFFRNQVEELEKEIKERNHKFLSKGDMSGKDDWPNIWPDGTSAMNAEVEHIVLHLRKEIAELLVKLQDTSEENERLLELYEKAMRERDDARRMWWNSGGKSICGEHVPDMEDGTWVNAGGRETLIQGHEEEIQDSVETTLLQEHASINRDGKAETEVIHMRMEVEECQMKLKEITEENERLIDMYEKAMQEKDDIRKLWQDTVQNRASTELNATIRGIIESQELRNETEQLKMGIVPEKACDELRIELEDGKRYLKFGMKDNEHQEETRGALGAPNNGNMPQTEVVFASSDVKSEHPEQNLELWQQEMIDEIQNLRTELRRMSQENEKLAKMHEKAIFERNVLVKLWQKAADALKHAENIDLLKGDRCHNIARSLHIVSGSPLCSPVAKETEGLEEMKQQGEEKDIQISESHHGIFFTQKGGAVGVQEQSDFGKNMDDNLDSDRIFSLLTKEADELQLKMKEMADEYEKLLVMYEETANDNDKIRNILQKTSQELENSTQERTLFSREIEDLKSKLKNLIDSNEDMVQGNEKPVQQDAALNIRKDSSNNVDVRFAVNQSDELQSLAAESESGTDVGNSREAITVAVSAENIEKFNALVPDLHAWIGEKLKALKEYEQQVQKLFEEMDVKFGKCGLSMDNLDILRKKFEIDLDLIQGQVTELLFSIAINEKKLQAMQLEHERLEMRLQESEHSEEDLSHLSSDERCKWAENGSNLPGDKDLIVNQEKMLQQEITLARSKLAFAQERITEITRVVDSLGLIEISHNEMEFFRKESESLKQEIAHKKQEIDTMQKCANQMQAKKVRVYNKFSALETLLSDFSASEEYWKSRESRANAKVETFGYLVREKMEEMSLLQADKKAIETALKQTMEIEAITQAEVCDLTEKVQLAEQQRIDAEKTVVVQLEKQAVSSPDLRSSSEQVSTHFGKAATLLKGEEERNKLFTALKKSSDQVKDHRAKIKKLEANLKLTESSIQQLESQIQAGSDALKEAELSLQRILNEKQILIDSHEEASREMDALILELQSSEFEVKSKEEELKSNREVLQDLISRLAELEGRNICDEKMKEQIEPDHCSFTQLVLSKLKDIHAVVWEADTSLGSLQVAQNEASRELDT